MNNIYYVFQPIIDVKTNEIFGYEALMRAKDVSIVEIINNCETYEDFYTLERETFFKACKEYKKRGYDKHIFINSFPHIILSGKDFNLFMNKHYDLMEKMVIEILESPDIDIKAQRDKIYISKKYNFLLAMDDFGSRDNDFNDIYVIQPDIIKIDRGLVTDITNNKENQEVVQRLFDICSKKGIKLLAEGIETKEEYDYFVDLGVDYAQGYYISKPT